MMKRTANEQHY